MSQAFASEVADGLEALSAHIGDSVASLIKAAEAHRTSFDASVAAEAKAAQASQEELLATIVHAVTAHTCVPHVPCVVHHNI
jgi:serine/threonine protein phosphatase PrpC